MGFRSHLHLSPRLAGSASVFDAKIAFKSQAGIRLIEQPTMSLTRALALALARRIDDFLFDVAPVR